MDYRLEVKELLYRRLIEDISRRFPYGRYMLSGHVHMAPSSGLYAFDSFSWDGHITIYCRKSGGKEWRSLRLTCDSLNAYQLLSFACEVEQCKEFDKDMEDHG